MVSFYRRHDGSLEVKLEAGVLRLALRTGSRDLPKAWHRCREPSLSETLRAHFCPAPSRSTLAEDQLALIQTGLEDKGWTKS
jgi:hypothetical protein